jgi:hypothetical protein
VSPTLGARPRASVSSRSFVASRRSIIRRRHLRDAIASSAATSCEATQDDGLPLVLFASRRLPADPRRAGGAARPRRPSPAFSTAAFRLPLPSHGSDLPRGAHACFRCACARDHCGSPRVAYRPVPTPSSRSDDLRRWVIPSIVPTVQTFPRVQDTASDRVPFTTDTKRAGAPLATRAGKPTREAPLLPPARRARDGNHLRFGGPAR